jgi:hypothetical protein
MKAHSCVFLILALVKSVIVLNLGRMKRVKNVKRRKYHAVILYMHV